VPDLEGSDILANYNNIPVPAFINVVFGEQLGLPFSLDPSLASQEDLVTLRLADKVSPAELFRIARNTLRAYGVGMRNEEGIYVFYIDKNVARGDVPIIVSGRALPDVPPSHRPIFMFVPLEVVSNAKVRSWVTTAMRGRDIEVQEDPTRNAIVLKGNQLEVEQALAMVKLLDKPHMRGKFSASIEPAFTQVQELAVDLLGILQAEGYDASMKPPIGSVMLIPLKANNQLVVFAPSEEILAHVENWVHIIDRRQQLSIKDGIFTYEVQSTHAGYIVDLLNELNQGREGEDGVRSRFVVDSNRNAIIYRGSGQAWADLLPVIEKMDKLAPSVLIEVLLAEISLLDNETSSFQFFAEMSYEGWGLSGGTLGLIDSGTSAFQAALDNAGETRAILKVLYENNRAEIRSRPRLMVKSGQSASIDVGDEIPVLTTSSQSTSGADTPLVQDIVYRNTGVRLEIRPVVHSSGYVDVEVSQELSEAEVNETSGIDSPTIRNRKLQTTVTLRDGGSVLLGGLISNVRTDNETGVPFFGTLPGVGALFKSQGDRTDRRELVIMIIPYVLDTPEDSENLSEMMTGGLLSSTQTTTNNP
jgi:general secretion pathway protein D